MVGARLVEAVYGGEVQTTWQAALAWRLRRHHLEPGHEATAVDDVVERLVAVPAWSGDPERAIGTRLERPGSDSVEHAVADGRLIKVFAFRGATHLMTPERGADHLALRAAGRMWERASWRSHYRLEPDDWPSLRAAVREALVDGPLTPGELAAAVAADRRFSHLRDDLSRIDTFVKPFFWQGDVCFGPPSAGQPTLQALANNSRWPGIPDLEDAGRRAVLAYLSAYGPASAAHLQYWLGEGLGAGSRRVQGWLTDVRDRLQRVRIAGVDALILAEHAAELVSMTASRSVKLLAGHDQWVLGPGTADPQVVPPAHRSEVTRGAALLVVGGVVRGTWRNREGTVTVSPWDGLDLSEEHLAAEIERVSRLGGGQAPPDRAS